MFRKITDFFVSIVQRYLPDPFIFAILLTFAVFGMGVFMIGESPLRMVTHWSTGLWSLLGFTTQMAMILVTGHALALSSPIKKTLSRMADVPKTPKGAIVAVTFVATLACYLNWGFGLVVGALYAKELARKIPKVDYRLLIASGYTGFVIWHAGFSGSIPLLVASGGPDVVKATAGVVKGLIPIQETLFAPVTLVPVLVILFTMPFLNSAMHPTPEKTVSIDPELLKDELPEISTKNDTVADKLENSWIISVLVSLLGFAYIIMYFAGLKNFNLNLNVVIGIFLFGGILFHGTPRRFLAAFSVAAKGAGPILLQFPFYAGIMGMMVGKSLGGSSIAGVMSEFFVAISTSTTFPFYTYLSAGLVNFFVPSGGGQWAVQAPIMMPAGAQLSVDHAKTAMAIAWGDAWTNMIQPFWALPALSIAGLGARDIMGYCVIVLIYTGMIIGGSFLLF